jgi:predicted nucleotidyltransferase
VNRAAPFDPLRVLRELNDAGVRYVVIGAFAGRLLGSPTLTRDLDICYARDPANLDALAGVLRSLHARLRGVDEDLPFQLDARAPVAGDSFAFVTDAGDLDLLGTPQGTAGYDDLAKTATETDLDGVVALVASIDDLIRMKRAAGRRKDLIEVEVLGALRDEIDQAR